MKVLVVGGGGREHALVWKIAQSPTVDKVYCAPGNPGIAELAECVTPGDSVGALADFACEHDIDLTVVGPEAPLVAGIVDEFKHRGLAVFGPTRAAAMLESSKAFAKDFMARHDIPTAEHRTFNRLDDALRFIDAFAGFEAGRPLVVKADGLAAGKGVIIAENRKDAEAAARSIMAERAFGAAGDRVVIEEFLEGEEVTVLAFSDGATVVPMVSSQDHKRLMDGDAGPNTGGMGAYAPVPAVSEPLRERVLREILAPAVRGMAEEGTPYAGVLYAGLILTVDGPKVLEFNARFGDPEAQVVLPLLETDLISIIEAVLAGRLASSDIRWRKGAAACVVLVSGGYPGRYETGKEIRGLEQLEGLEGVVAFHASTKLAGGRLVTAGGRVLDITALGDCVGDAVARAYEACERVGFEGAYYRRDIGWRAGAHRDRIAGRKKF
ncbi:MAG: phosphoribosylamine--glycine ligase [Firmicutes bacterium]|nr:phosphoribosylamine--glycine ligase [Bacillota bacterium]